MAFYKFFPTPSDRMGTIWTLSTIKDAYIIEFGPAGTTHFEIEGMMQFNADHNANVYTTHINETDISFGKQDRLENAILEIDGQYGPKYIFVMASSISAIIGTDIESVCYELQPKVKAKLIPITTGGYHGDHTLGIEATMDMLCKEVVQETVQKKPNTYNIVGNNGDVFNFLSDVEEIKNLMKSAFNFDVNTTFTAYTSMEEIEKAGEAQFNLVLRGEGLKAADTLKKNHGIGYHYGRPYGLEGTTFWLKSLEKALGIPADEQYIAKKTAEIRKHLMNYRFMTRGLNKKNVLLVGDYDVVVGLAALVEELGLTVEAIILKHKMNRKAKKHLPEKWKRVMKLDYSEREMEAYLSETPSYLLLADEATLKLENKSKLHFQIANPNFSKHSIYPYTPFVGYHGALYFMQCLYELQKGNPEA